jgi:hypothetical protein
MRQIRLPLMRSGDVVEFHGAVSNPVRRLVDGSRAAKKGRAGDGREQGTG